MDKKLRRALNGRPILENFDSASLNKEIRWALQMHIQGDRRIMETALEERSTYLEGFPAGVAHAVFSTKDLHIIQRYIHVLSEIVRSRSVMPKQGHESMVYSWYADALFQFIKPYVSLEDDDADLTYGLCKKNINVEPFVTSLWGNLEHLKCRMERGNPWTYMPHDEDMTLASELIRTLIRIERFDSSGTDLHRWALELISVHTRSEELRFYRSVDPEIMTLYFSSMDNPMGIIEYLTALIQRANRADLLLFYTQIICKSLYSARMSYYPEENVGAREFSSALQNMKTLWQEKTGLDKNNPVSEVVDKIVSDIQSDTQE